MIHTELPWKRFKTNNIQNEFSEVVIWGSGFSKIKTEANAAFIVKAVNNHYELLQALKNLVAITANPHTAWPDVQKEVMAGVAATHQVEEG